MDQHFRKLWNVDTENEEVTKKTDMPEELSEAWTKALVRLHAKIVKQAEEHYAKVEETETCESNSDAHPR